MNILAADTSTNTLYLCLMTDKSKISLNLTGGLQHSENLVPKIIELTKDLNIELRDIDLLVCTKGPGSFTGLRIAMSALKGISVASGAPLVAIETNKLLAYPVSYFDGTILTSIDARKKRFYISLFKNNERLTKDLDINEKETIELLKDEKKVLITGPDSKKFYDKLLKAEIGEKLPNLEIFVDESQYDLAYHLAVLGKLEYEKNGPAPLGFGPSYIRKSDAEIALDKKIKDHTN
ncbi:MAG: tRNA (adenosine(37)-N6)-threonylcarbamoyltransferase complex dimerization subunit type 1 TsaB [Sphaerochaetaceae bacterium]|nr:tRNA (adenosine(37)-N6)-threonylcarbamoyltransferase complex dimerization subunit type 1 TsaB [Sphaerochaetaceae bacterium]